MPLLAIIVDSLGHELAEQFKLWLPDNVKLPTLNKNIIKTAFGHFLTLIDEKLQKSGDFKPVFGHFGRVLPKIPNFQIKIL